MKLFTLMLRYSPYYMLSGFVPTACPFQVREEDGKRPSQSVVDAMAAVNLHAMRLGPGKHLKGKTLFNGLVSPEEVRTFVTFWGWPR
jgi:hypothetical protein